MGMEPDIKDFLTRVMNSLFAGVAWLAANSTFGIMYGFAFPENKIGIGNIIFYVWFVASLAFLIWLYLRIWKKPLEKNEE